MAQLPGRRAELRPLTRGALLSILCALGTASPATGQVAEASVVRISAGTEVLMTRLADEWVPQTSGALMFDVTPWIQIGGAGQIGLAHPTVRAPAELRVRFGYGGLRVAVRPALERWPGLGLTLLAGAGNVDMQEPTHGNTVDSENGGILEPGIIFTRPLGARVGLLASASWRFAFAFEAAVGSNDLRGPALGIGLVFGPL